MVAFCDLGERAEENARQEELAAQLALAQALHEEEEAQLAAQTRRAEEAEIGAHGPRHTDLRL